MERGLVGGFVYKSAIHVVAIYRIVFIDAETRASVIYGKCTSRNFA